MLAEAAKLRSKNMYPALVLDLNCGLRDKELRELRWQQIDLVHKKQLTVGKSKTDAGTGRVIPLNDTVMIALEAHAAWYIRRFGECKPEWYVFPAGKGQPNDPTRPVTTLRTAWTKVRDKAKVVGRWHDNRHTLVTELAESGAGDEVIMSIAGHVSRAMLSRYSHVRMEAKRRALDEIAARQRAADEKRKEEAEAAAGCGGHPTGVSPVVAAGVGAWLLAASIQLRGRDYDHCRWTGATGQCILNCCLLISTLGTFLGLVESSCASPPEGQFRDYLRTRREK